MGRVSVSSRTSRTVAVQLAALSSNCTVELLRSPVDRAGQDPATTVLRSWSSAAFPLGSGTVSTAVDTASDCFVRPEVPCNGIMVAIGNPT
jgi:hypothetical protein